MTMTTERTTPLGSTVLYEDNLTLLDGTVLRSGDEFTLKGKGEDGAVGYFRFKHFRLHDGGEETVLAWGGDRNPKARQSFRTFLAADVEEGAVKL